MLLSLVGVEGTPANGFSLIKWFQSLTRSNNACLTSDTDSASQYLPEASEPSVLQAVSALCKLQVAFF